MSTWTSKVARSLAFAAVFYLAGCLDTVTSGVGASNKTPSAFNVPVMSQVDVFGGDVVVAGPKGYCIDRQSLSRSPEGAFVLIASCESLTGASDTFVDPAVLTVSILPAQPGSVHLKAAELSTLAATSGVLHAEDSASISLVQLPEGGDRILPDGDAKYWRASTSVNDHVVGLAAYGPKGSFVAGDGGRQLLIDLKEALQRLSP